MPPETHAALSASSSARWLHCPPSVRLSEGYKDEGSVYAAEGTSAHLLSEHKLRAALGMETKNPVEDLSFYNREMEDCSEAYVAFVTEQLEALKAGCKDPIVLVEQRVDFSRWVPNGFGTADCIIVADGVLAVIDFKYGQGVAVSAENNTQMKLYALGALEIFDALYSIDEVQMSIFQPRKANVSTWSIRRSDLLEWADKELAPIAKLAYNGEGEFSCGEWCRFCKARAECRERAAHNLQLAKYDFRPPALLEDSEIAYILGRLDSLTSWANDIKDYALRAAIGGKEWPGYKLVEGRSSRRYTDEAAVAEAVKAAGFDPYEHKVLGVTGMTRMLGKKRFEEIVGGYITKPAGKPTLVPESDKRPAMTNDFMEEKL